MLKADLTLWAREGEHRLSFESPPTIEARLWHPQSDRLVWGEVGVRVVDVKLGMSLVAVHDGDGMHWFMVSAGQHLVCSRPGEARWLSVPARRLPRGAAIPGPAAPDATESVWHLDCRVREEPYPGGLGYEIVIPPEHLLPLRVDRSRRAIWLPP